MGTRTNKKAALRSSPPKMGRGWAVCGLILAAFAAASPIMLAKLTSVGDLPQAGVDAEILRAPATGASDVLALSDTRPPAPDIESLAPAVVEVPLVDTAPAGPIVSSTDRTIAEMDRPDTGNVLHAPQTVSEAPSGVARDLPQTAAAPSLPDLRPNALSRTTDAFAQAGTSVRTGETDRAPVATAPSAMLQDTAAVAPTPPLPVALSAELAEAALDLDPTTQRQVQQGLRVLGFDPRGVDGVFGPNTRLAIAKWQRAQGQAGTGYLEPGQRDQIIAESAPVIAQRARQRRAAERRVATVEIEKPAVPAARNAPECARDGRGTIIENQSFSCDLTVLQESLSDLFGGRG